MRKLLLYSTAALMLAAPITIAAPDVAQAEAEGPGRGSAANGGRSPGGVANSSGGGSWRFTPGRPNIFDKPSLRHHVPGGGPGPSDAADGRNAAERDKGGLDARQ
jgi:hypothetical protein